jgi:hypothetical protein
MLAILHLWKIKMEFYQLKSLKIVKKKTLWCIMEKNWNGKQKTTALSSTSKSLHATQQSNFTFSNEGISNHYGPSVKV